MEVEEENEIDDNLHSEALQVTALMGCRIMAAREQAPPRRDSVDLSALTRTQRWRLTEEYLKLMHDCELCSQNFEQHDDLFQHIFDEHADLEIPPPQPDVPEPKEPKKTKERAPPSLEIFRSGASLVCCSICRRGYDLKAHLASHIATAHLDLRSCHGCYTPSLTLTQHYRHKDRCKIQLPNIKGMEYCCELCLRSFLSAKLYEIHFAQEHAGTTAFQPSNTAACRKKCGKVFAGEVYLERHIATMHTNPKLYACDLCPKLLQTLGGLSLHIKSHDPYFRKFACKRCPRTFTHRTSLRAHEVSHAKKRRSFPCKRCNKKYATSGGLAIHVKVQHLGIKDKMCSVCGDTFGKGTHLRIHMRIHTGEKAYACHVCDKRYATKFESHLHLMNHHNILPQACTQCDARFRLQRELLAHVEKEHPYKNSKK